MKHLAQVNIGRVLGGPDDPRMVDFFANLARVNGLAERMPGFVWRLKDDTGVAAMAMHWPGDPTMNVNMSVWESPEALGKFVFQTVHRGIYARKHEFFETPKENDRGDVVDSGRPHSDAGRSEGTSRPFDRPRRLRLRVRLGRSSVRENLSREEVRLMPSASSSSTARKSRRMTTSRCCRPASRRARKSRASATTNACPSPAIAACVLSNGSARPSRRRPARCR